MSQQPSSSLAALLIRSPSESASDFNTRLRNACTSQTAPPYTDFTAAVVNGVPVISLISHMVPATAEDVQDAAANGESELKEGDPIPDGDELIIQVMQLLANSDKLAEDTEGRGTKMLGRFDGNVVRTEVVKGLIPVLVDAFGADGKATGQKLMITEEVSYLVVAYAMEEGDGGDGDDV